MVKLSTIKMACDDQQSMSGLYYIFFINLTHIHIFGPTPTPALTPAPTLAFILALILLLLLPLFLLLRPGRRIVDDDRLQRLLQPSEIVVNKSFRWLDLKKTSEIVVNDG